VAGHQAGTMTFTTADELPLSLMNKDFRRFMRELRDTLLMNGVYIDRIKAVHAAGDTVIVYSDAIVVELSWSNKSVLKVRERL
jgi:hypothetical protein